VILAAAVLADCSMTGTGRREHPTDLVTRTSLGGIHLRDSPATVEDLYGPGRRLGGHGLAFHYQAGLTAYYFKRSDAAMPELIFVEATSSRFRTASGVGIGSALSSVKAMGSMDCGPTSQRRVECLTHAYGPGLQFVLVDGKVTSLALVLRTN